MTRWSAMTVRQGMRVTGGADRGSRPCLIRHRMENDENWLTMSANDHDAIRTAGTAVT
jgi:hypothetical protein